MSRVTKVFSIVTIFFALLGVSCYTGSNQLNISDYKREIKGLIASVNKNPRDAMALRELGVIYFKTGYHSFALDYLKNAYKLNSRSAKTLFYLGMTLEATNRKQLAILAYENYKRIIHQSPYRKLMEGRYYSLIKHKMREEVRVLLAQQEQLSTVLSPLSVAVFPLTYEGTDQRFAPLGRGMSEMIIGDLGKVRNLRLLERMRLQVLLDEMALGQSKLVDRQTAPRFGKLLGAGRLIGGTFNVVDGKQLLIDVEYWDILQSLRPKISSKKDALKNLFKLEKELVFALIEEMGIQLSPREREQILRVPTRNLQAFLAYSTGLELEDAGNFKAATRLYQQAKNLDPNFRLAEKKAETAESLSEGGATTEDALIQIEKIELQESLPTVSSGDLVNSRQQNLGSNVGSNFVPGQETQKSAEEATSSGADLGDLPEPPQPPDRGSRSKKN